jgi:hypothetical protein
MQKIAAYLMERHDEMNWPEARSAEVAKLKVVVEDWLRSKGAPEIAQAGVYKAEDGSRATYTIQEAEDGDRTWWMARLEEVSKDARRFHAAVSITNSSDRVVVYATLEAGSEATLVGPIDTDPKCPRVVRTLLKRPGRWYHGRTELRGLRRLIGFDEGRGLASEIENPDRTVPFIVVTEEEQRVVLPGLERDLDSDLAGLANVIVLDKEATWGLTDTLGARLSCYSGAVRLYWPRFSLKREDPFRHPLWPASRLRPTTGDSDETRKRFRRQLRALVMDAAALSVVRPREIDGIRSAANRRNFADLTARFRELEDYAGLADLFQKDKEELLVEKAELEEQVAELQSEIVKLKADRAALKYRLQEKGLAGPVVSGEDIAPVSTLADDGDLSEPVSAEVRFYKKVARAGNHDVMIRWKNCNHNKWQPGHSGDQGKKGIAKIENGRTDWRTVEHCGTCTGGGVWKVQW